MLGRRALVGLVAAILGIAAIPAASYSTTTTETKEKGAKAENPAKALRAAGRTSQALDTADA